MRKTLFLTAVVILAVGLLFAWADEKKTVVEDNSQQVLNSSNHEYRELTAEERAILAQKHAEQKKAAEAAQISNNESQIVKPESDEVKVANATSVHNPNIALKRQAKENAKAEAAEAKVSTKKVVELSEFDKAKIRYTELKEEGFVDEAELKRLDNILNPPSENPITTGLLTDYAGSESFDADLGEFTSYIVGDSTSPGWQWVASQVGRSGCAFHNDDNLDTLCEDYLVSNGSYTIPSTGSVNLIYDEYVNYGSYADEHLVMISTDFAGDPETCNWDILRSTIGTEDTWVTITIPLDGTGGGTDYRGQTVNVAFYYQGQNASEWWIDYVTVGGAATGRCCDYSDPVNPTCTNNVIEADCSDPTDEWVNGGNCTANPCASVSQGDNCYYPMAVTIPAALPYSDIDQTTLARGNNKIVSGCGYTQDEDMVYELTVTVETAVNITIDPQTTPYTAIAVMSACDGSGTCLDYSYETSGNEHSIDGLVLSVGTYYLWVDSYVYSGGDYIPSFTLTIEEYTIPTGRCCYYDEDPPDLYNPLCADDITESDCNTLIGSYSGYWTEGLDCTADPCPVLPANDNCTDAIAVGPGVYYADNFLATTDGIGTHTINQDIWYCYTASTDGFATIDLCGSDFDTKIAVWQDCTCPPTTEIAYNDDDCDAMSRVQISISNGTQYLIQAGAYDDYVGNIVLSIAEEACTPPANDECVDAINIDTYPASGSATCFCATNSCAYDQDIWFALDLPYEWNNIEIKICPTEADIADGGISFSLDCDCNAYVDASSFIFPDTTCTEGYDGATLYLDNYHSTSRGTLYWPAWGIDADGKGLAFNYTINVTEGTAPAEGDHCSNPFVIPSFPYADTGNTCSFNDFCDVSGYDAADVIYEFTVTNAAVYSFSLCNSSYDTKIAVYKDACCTGPSDHVLYNDDNSTVCGSGGMSYVEGTLVPGTYYAVVDGYDGDCGDYILEITETPLPTGACCYGSPLSPSCIAGVTEVECFDTTGSYDGYSWVEDGTCPDACPAASEGDFCENAKVISSLPYLDTGNTGDYNDGCSTKSTSPDVIYELTLTESTELLFSLCNSDFDTYLSIYEDECCGDSTLYFNDDECGNRSQIRATMDPGLYYIVVEGYNAYYGDYELYVGAPPTGRCCVGDPFNPTCVDGIEVDSCDVLEGAWVEGESCPCPVCDITCPTGGIAEGESDCGFDYVDTYNGGCNSDPVVFQPINAGDIICGTSGTFLSVVYDTLGTPVDTADSRDTDWFQITFTQQQIVTWKAVAEFPIALIVFDGTEGCDDKVTVGSIAGDLCDTTAVGPVLVNPGTYWFFIAPNTFGDTYYNCPKEYVAWLTVEDLPPTPANDHCTGAETITPGTTTYGYNYNADVDADAPECDYDPATSGPGVWYKVTGTGNTMTASTCNEYSSVTSDEFDTRINIYAGTCNDLLCIVGDDDSCDDSQYYTLLSVAEWCSELGVDYYILVYGYQEGDLGYFQLDLTEGDACSAALGRCCYGNTYDFSCVDSVTLLDCYNTYGGLEWLADGNCVDDPCPLNPGFDIDPTSVEGYVDSAGVGHVDNETLTVSNLSSTTTLTFSATTTTMPVTYTAGWRNANPIDAKVAAEGTVNGRSAVETPLVTSDILLEGFEEGIMPPTNWSVIIDDSLWTWGIDDYSPFEGTYKANITYDSLLNAQDEWIVSPAFDLSTYSIPVSVDFYWYMSYYWGVDPYDNYDLEVWVSLDGGLTFTDMLFTEDSVGVFTNFTWYPASVSLADYMTETNVAIGWRYVGTDGAQLCLDAIRFNDDPPSWLSIDVDSDSVLAGANMPITVTMDASYLECDTYNGSVIFTTNDPYNSVVSVDVEFVVCQHGYEYNPGDANMAAGLWPPTVVGGDVTYLVNYFRGIVPACNLGGFYASADINASCTITGGDVTRLVNYFRGMNSIDYCPDYEPAWLGGYPPDEPANWPNCE